MVVSIFFSVGTFFDVEALLEITGFFFQIKIIIALIALLHLKKTKPKTQRTIKVKH